MINFRSKCSSEGSCGSAGITIATMANYAIHISLPFVTFIRSMATWFVLKFFLAIDCVLFMYIYVFGFNSSLKL